MFYANDSETTLQNITVLDFDHQFPCYTPHSSSLFSGSFRVYIVEEPVQKRAIEMLRCFPFIQISLNFSIIFTVNSYLVGVLIFGFSLYKMQQFRTIREMILKVTFPVSRAPTLIYVSVKHLVISINVTHIFIILCNNFRILDSYFCSIMNCCYFLGSSKSVT